jgi:AraC-like DNA-binding protein
MVFQLTALALLFRADVVSHVASKTEDIRQSKILLNTRLEYGLALLQTTTSNVSEIAYGCGFSTPSHFADLFKKRSGLQPSGPCLRSSWGIVRAHTRRHMHAICLQHEIDHLQGKLFIDRLFALRRFPMHSKLAAMQREQVDRTVNRSSPAV